MIILLNFLQSLFGLIFFLPTAAAIYFMHFSAEITFRIACLTPIRKITARNINLLFPKVDGLLLADKLLKNVSYSIFEVLCTPFFKETHLNMIGRVDGSENLDLALAKKKGALLLIMHTGNYELIPTILSGKGYQLTSILKAPPDPIFKLLNRSRAYRGTRLINVLEENMYQEASKSLAEGRLVCILIDTGALEGKHELFPFLGRKVPVATGWLTLAQRSQAPVIPVSSQREDKKVLLTFGEPMSVTGDNREAVMLRIGQFFESFINRHPEQWAIFLNEYEVKRMVEGR